MNKVNNRDERLKAIEIIQDAIVVYKDGLKELFDAIYITDESLITGRIVNVDDLRVFVEEGGIPKQNVLRIEGGKKMKVFRKDVRNYDKRRRKNG